MQADPLAEQLIDPILAAVGWIGGLMLLGVAASVLGLAWWWAEAMDPPDLPRVIARAFLAGVGLGAERLALRTQLAEVREETTARAGRRSVARGRAGAGGAGDLIT